VNALRAAAARQLRDCWEKMSKPREREMLISRPGDSTRAADLLSDLCIMNALSNGMESVFRICAPRGAFAQHSLTREILIIARWRSASKRMIVCRAEAFSFILLCALSPCLRRRRELKVNQARFLINDHTHSVYTAYTGGLIKAN
jgi:hypothetical protein